MSYLRRVAMSLAEQLPDTKEDAERVLEYMRELIEWEHRKEADQSSVLSFPTKPSLSAI